MAEISGNLGAVYFNEKLTDTSTTSDITFSTGGTITSSSAIDFEDKGYVEGMLVTVSGCATTANNGIFTITGVSDLVLTVSEAVTGVAPDTAEVTFTEAEPGIQVLGFFNWALNSVGDSLEITDFDDSSGGRSYIPGMTGWTVTAEKHFLDANNEVDDWVGETCEIRLFLNYLSSTGTPSTGSPSQYWKGNTIVTGLSMATPVDALINQSITFQGDKALTLKTQDQLWNLGIST